MLQIVFHLICFIENRFWRERSVHNCKACKLYVYKFWNILHNVSASFPKFSSMDKENKCFQLSKPQCEHNDGHLLVPVLRLILKSGILNFSEWSRGFLLGSMFLKWEIKVEFCFDFILYLPFEFENKVYCKNLTYLSHNNLVIS